MSRLIALCLLSAVLLQVGDGSPLESIKQKIQLAVSDLMEPLFHSKLQLEIKAQEADQKHKELVHKQRIAKLNLGAIPEECSMMVTDQDSTCQKLRKTLDDIQALGPEGLKIMEEVGEVLNVLSNKTMECTAMGFFKDVHCLILVLERLQDAYTSYRPQVTSYLKSVAEVSLIFEHEVRACLHKDSTEILNQAVAKAKECAHLRTYKPVNN